MVIEGAPFVYDAGVGGTRWRVVRTWYEAIRETPPASKRIFLLQYISLARKHIRARIFGGGRGAWAWCKSQGVGLGVTLKLTLGTIERSR